MSRAATVISLPDLVRRSNQRTGDGVGRLLRRADLAPLIADLPGMTGLTRELAHLIDLLDATATTPAPPDRADLATYTPANVLDQFARHAASAEVVTTARDTITTAMRAVISHAARTIADHADNLRAMLNDELKDLITTAHAIQLPETAAAAISAGTSAAWQQGSELADRLATVRQRQQAIHLPTDTAAAGAPDAYQIAGILGDPLAACPDYGPLVKAAAHYGYPPEYPWPSLRPDSADTYTLLRWLTQHPETNPRIPSID